MSWTGFTLLVLTTYVGLNTAFGFLYFMLPPEAVQGSEAPTETGRLLNDFFFSGHTLTTVGYGNLVPHGIAANLTATLEALVGLLTFSVITGFLVARVSRPSARIGYSRNALIAPYNGGQAVMFRIANERSNSLMELKAQVTLMSVVNTNGTPERKFDVLPLERDSVILFPLTWTIVHPIDEKQPVPRQDPAGSRRHADGTYHSDQGLRQRPSARRCIPAIPTGTVDEFVWGAKFLPAFKVEEAGDLLLEVDKLGEYIMIASQ